ncbi:MULTISPECIES: MbtH family NRPS accessory protein [Streptomyces]|uniref:MbtH-like domain-containing protein n=1 Tax=Streptomyces venezuelae TaxID=54571 RepID=A0A5P2BFU2_STRVZ|nr:MULTISPECIES: MbtH family NRPS accessory protein [Streptomyces]NEA00400.1 MbtH family NRPS accessory protein [Streptomyces sp. SID10116]MYY84753.1 MbtH family NRPS accessory protein [Streptomyces sp. SID335]MYZ17017.1 MbtH family NRPS accessory protein [Streptomyces sp. SID337]NDZ85211.1 MbtH family NRPS accessory protein [Streptomyces sp. SID10115]NEB45307.1 MbtH family NRPS accessory protein [Streptomyces sp. SID339]
MPEPVAADAPQSESEPHYRVVVNDEEQYSIWPLTRDVPAGWHSLEVSGPESRCLDHIAEVWTDMRPLSLRQDTAAGAPAVRHA